MHLKLFMDYNKPTKHQNVPTTSPKRYVYHIQEGTFMERSVNVMRLLDPYQFPTFHTSINALLELYQFPKFHTSINALLELYQFPKFHTSINVLLELYQF